MHGRKYTLKELPLVVNGDDILFRAINHAHYELWKHITKVCGLKFSIGKNYTSRNLLVINSELYKVTRNGLRQLPQLNMRLLYGGTRSSAGGLTLQPEDLLRSLVSAQGMGEEFYSKHIGTDKTYIDEEYRKSKSGKAVMAKLEAMKYPPTTKNVLTMHALRERVSEWEREQPARLESYKKWFVTVDARQNVFTKQLKGDFGFDNVDDEVREGLPFFRSRQLRQLRTFSREFPRLSRLTLANYLPRTLGGLGLMPPPSHRYTNIDCAVAQLAHDSPAGAFALVQMNHIGLVQSHLMACATSEISGVCRTLGVRPKLILENELDEHKERYGTAESPFTGSFMRGFANLSATVSEDDYLAKHEKYITVRNQVGGAGWKEACEFNRKVKERCARWEKEGKVKRWVPEDVDLNVHPERLLGGFWQTKVQMYPIMV